MFMMMASVGLPGTSGFVGEMLVLVGAWHASSWVAFFTATGLVLGATYMLWLYRRVMFGEVVNDEVKTMEPMDGREFLIFVPLTILVLLFGVYPMALLDVMETSVQFMLNGLAASGLPLLAAQ
jgi:NADH-quinone oxidoreductase subunit M